MQLRQRVAGVGRDECGAVGQHDAAQRRSRHCGNGVCQALACFVGAAAGAVREHAESQAGGGRIFQHGEVVDGSGRAHWHVVDCGHADGQRLGQRVDATIRNTAAVLHAPAKCHRSAVRVRSCLELHPLELAKGVGRVRGHHRRAIRKHDVA